MNLFNNLSHRAMPASEDFVTEQRWQSFVRRVEDMLGHDLDGDLANCGYSLDHARAAFLEGQSVVEYALGVKAVTS